VKFVEPQGAAFGHQRHRIRRHREERPREGRAPLADGGAHCGYICDASMPTYMTFVRGQAIMEEGRRTGELPGRLVRGPQRV